MLLDLSSLNAAHFGLLSEAVGTRGSLPTLSHQNLAQTGAVGRAHVHGGTGGHGDARGGSSRGLCLFSSN